LSKLNIDFSQSLDGRSLEELKPDELYALSKVLPGFTQDYRLQVYKGVVQEALEQGSVTLSRSLKSFQPLRQNLQLSEETHWTVLDRLQVEEPTLFYPPRRQSRDTDATVLSSLERRTAIAQTTVYKSADQSSTTPPKGKPASRNTQHTTDADATLLNFIPQEAGIETDTENNPESYSSKPLGESTVWRDPRSGSEL
jgi:hypothetical protein